MDSNQGPSAYQPNTLLLGQTISQWLWLYCQMATQTVGCLTAGWVGLYCQMATLTAGWIHLYSQMATLTAGSQFCLLFLHHDIVILVDWA